MKNEERMKKRMNEVSTGGMRKWKQLTCVIFEKIFISFVLWENIMMSV